MNNGGITHGKSNRLISRLKSPNNLLSLEVDQVKSRGNAILTGFGKYGPHSFNPAEDIVNILNGKNISGYNIKGVILPCTYFGAYETLKQLFEIYKPKLVINLGLSTCVKGITLENNAYNIMDGIYPDENSFKPSKLKIVEGGEDIISLNANIEFIKNLLKKKGIIIYSSIGKNVYFCNSLAYLTAYYSIDIKSVFIHTPWTSKYKTKIKNGEGKVFIEEAQLIKTIEIIISNIKNI